MREHYFHRFRKRLFRELSDFVKAQLLVGFIITGLILWWQVRTGIITKPNIRANVSSFVWPYIAVLVVFTVYHLGRTAFLLDRESQNRIAELENAQRSTGNCAGGPEIYLKWETPKDVAGLGITKRQFFAENRSSVDAYAVKIEDISVDVNKTVTAQFAEIDMLPTHSTQQVKTKVIGKVNPQYDDQFDMIYFEAKDIIPECTWVKDSGAVGITIPIIVTCKDYAGRAYRSTFDFVDDLSGLGLDTTVKFVKCERIN